MYYILVYLFYYVKNLITSYLVDNNKCVFNIESIISYPEKEILTNTFMSSKLWNPTNTCSFYNFNYRYGSKNYNLIVSKDKIDKIFPYSWDQLRHKKNNIISAKLYYSEHQDWSVDITDIIKKYAGPKENFYTDVNLSPKLYQILEVENLKKGILYIEYLTQTKMYKLEDVLKCN